MTPVLLCLAAIGLAVACVRRRGALPILLAIPIYYLGLQALMWAEFRHTLPVHASVFILIGVAATTAFELAVAGGRRWLGRPAA